MGGSRGGHSTKRVSLNELDPYAENPGHLARKKSRKQRPNLKQIFPPDRLLASRCVRW